MPGVRVDANVGGSDAGMNASSDPGSALLEVRGLSKSFGTLRALQEVDFTLRAGEIHALLGENGAGKSTLIKAVTGVFPRDAGIVRLGGAEVAPRSAKAAVDAGIATVYQEVNLLLNLSVAQNLYLGRQPTRFGLVREAEMRRCATELLAEFDLHIDVAEPLGNYSVAVQHIAAIARAVDQSARVLILDEPTASLDRHEVEILFAVMRKLALRGIGVVFVTHFLDQVYEICDRITVLRNGRLIGERTTAELPRIELIRMMLGRELAETTSERAAAQVRQVGEICARFENYGKAGYVAPFDLALRRGEVVGLAGLLGSGRTETARLVFGAERADSGSASVEGKPVRLQSPRDAVAHGFGYCPEERKTEGIIADLTVRENIVLALQAKRGLAKPLSRSEQEEIAMRFIKLLDIRPPEPERPIGLLSGGNQQKVLLARWLATAPRAPGARRTDPRHRCRRPRRDHPPDPRTVRRRPGAAGDFFRARRDRDLFGPGDRAARSRPCRRTGRGGHRRLQHSCGDCRSKHRRCGSRAVMMPSLLQTRPLQRLLQSRGLAQIIALLVILAVDRVVSPQFFDLRMQDGRLFGSLIDVLNRGAPVALLALGMVLVIATRGIDLSVGAVMAISGAIAASLADAHGLPLALAAALGAGLLCGLWNGFLVAVLGIQPIVATLILMVAGRGIAQLITEGRIVTFTAPDLVWLGNGAVLGVPAPVVIVLGMLIVTGAVVRGSALGLLIEATGGNARASELAGDRHARHDPCGLCLVRPVRGARRRHRRRRHHGRGCQQCRPLARARRHPCGGDRRHVAVRRALQPGAGDGRRADHPGHEHRYPAVGLSAGVQSRGQGGGGADRAAAAVAALRQCRRPCWGGPANEGSAAGRDHGHGFRRRICALHGCNFPISLPPASSANLLTDNAFLGIVADRHDLRDHFRRDRPVGRLGDRLHHRVRRAGDRAPRHAAAGRLCRDPAAVRRLSARRWAPSSTSSTCRRSSSRWRVCSSPAAPAS